MNKKQTTRRVVLVKVKDGLTEATKDKLIKTLGFANRGELPSGEGLKAEFKYARAAEKAVKRMQAILEEAGVESPEFDVSVEEAAVAE